RCAVPARAKAHSAAARQPAAARRRWSYSGLRMKKMLIAAVVLLLAAAGAWSWYALRSNGEAVRYRLAKVERGPIEVAVAASGTLNAVSTVQVAAPIPGQVKEIYADYNTPVNKGQVIARFEATPYELRVNQARAD